ncbi:MAG: hypothetical protein ACO1TE_20775 [Prosthecobacter sp.]
MTRFCFALMVAALLLQMTGCGKQPEDLFREAVMEPLPSSVQLIKTSVTVKMSSTENWIHFKVSPEDYKTLRSSEAFALFDAKRDVKSITDYHGAPDWWNPALLGDELIGLECEIAPHSGFDRSFKKMFVNKERNEVFFVLINWYNY